MRSLVEGAPHKAGASCVLMAASAGSQQRQADAAGGRAVGAHEQPGHGPVKAEDSSERLARAGHGGHDAAAVARLRRHGPGVEGGVRHPGRAHGGGGADGDADCHGGGEAGAEDGDRGSARLRGVAAVDARRPGRVVRQDLRVGAGDAVSDVVREQLDVVAPAGGHLEGHAGDGHPELAASDVVKVLAVPAEAHAHWDSHAHGAVVHAEDGDRDGAGGGGVGGLNRADDGLVVAEALGELRALVEDLRLLVLDPQRVGVVNARAAVGVADGRGALERGVGDPLGLGARLVVHVRGVRRDDGRAEVHRLVRGWRGDAAVGKVAAGDVDDGATAGGAVGAGGARDDASVVRVRVGERRHGDHGDGNVGEAVGASGEREGAAGHLAPHAGGRRPGGRLAAGAADARPAGELAGVVGAQERHHGGRRGRVVVRQRFQLGAVRREGGGKRAEARAGGRDSDVEASVTPAAVLGHQATVGDPLGAGGGGGAETGAVGAVTLAHARAKDCDRGGAGGGGVGHEDAAGRGVVVRGVGERVDAAH
mmetsp:Transcript_16801/g.39601  ORF Transcript_16801/g.39601 Transcript_16801/m.39601 type:complete len:536 (-) Transcript_16801:5752-7359(-)